MERTSRRPGTQSGTQRLLESEEPLGTQPETQMVFGNVELLGTQLGTPKMLGSEEPFGNRLGSATETRERHRDGQGGPG